MFSKFWLLLLVAASPLFALPDFDRAMGKGTAAWEYVETREDHENLNFYKKLHQKNFQRTSSRKIPKVLHFIWLGPKEFPRASLKNLASWIDKHPGWSVKFWTDIERPSPHPSLQMRMVQEGDLPHLLAHYFLSDNYGEKSELLRYEILFNEGGIYIDHDTFCHKSLEPLAFDFFCGLEKIGPSILSSSVFPTTHLIGAYPGHPIFAAAIVWLKKHWELLETSYPGTTPSAIHNRVKHRSFAALHEGVKEQIDQEENLDIVFPAAFFSLNEKGEDAFAIHTHASTWFQEERTQEKKIAEECDQVDQMLIYGEWLLTAAIALTAFSFGLFLFKRKKGALVSLLILASAQGFAEDFDKLMGKETKHWSYLTREEDNVFLQACKTLFNQQTPAMLSGKKSFKIPKVVHFIWLGPKSFPPESVENIRSWIKHHPDWTIKFWTDRDRPTPCQGMQKHFVKDFSFTKLERCFVQSQNYGEKSDILRYEILYQEGGVYADHDANSLQSFEPLHTSYDFYCGLEAPHEPFVGQSITCGNGVIGSKPRHPAVKQVIDLIAQRWDPLAKKFRGKDSYSRTEVVMQRTYIALTDVLKAGALNQEGNLDIVLPAAYFFAKSGIPSLYSKHFYATAWAETKEKKSDFQKASEKKLDKIQRKSKNITLLAIALLFFNIPFLVGILRRK